MANITNVVKSNASEAPFVNHFHSNGSCLLLGGALKDSFLLAFVGGFFDLHTVFEPIAVWSHARAWELLKLHPRPPRASDPALASPDLHGIRSVLMPGDVSGGGNVNQS
jgi:hypothetical protein